MKSKITAILLTLFLGGIGIHKFYLGQSFKGIIYLIFCWTFIPSILAFVDFVVLLFMSQNTFDIKYNNY
ncbi:TM2 domain-containing protein [Flavobacterium oreochromis]|uniref:TM2 domain-containing protein n=1 Tax=Flavobacterium columnare TaxID=996 RepID=A0A246G7P3_9FLAO|nr:TM2 domain-containing protein [Flavobacterium oreochromis]OWP74553.1 hypothetical protein BWK62_14010 [Flavobacterium oreochromis]POR26116.1 hypothetical protein BWK58_05620 [Flavobacterium columnare]